MKVYELIQALVYFPPEMEVFAQVRTAKLKFDIDGVNSEFRGDPLQNNNRAVIELDPW